MRPPTLALLALATLAAGCAAPAGLDPAADPASLATREVTEQAKGTWTAQASGGHSLMGSGWPSLDPPATFLAANLTVSWNAAHVQGPLVFQVFEPGASGPKLRETVATSPTTLAFGPDDDRLMGGGMAQLYPKDGAAAQIEYVVDAVYVVAAS